MAPPEVKQLEQGGKSYDKTMDWIPLLKELQRNLRQQDQTKNEKQTTADWSQDYWPRKLIE